MLEALLGLQVRALRTLSLLRNELRLPSPRHVRRRLLHLHVEREALLVERVLRAVCERPVVAVDRGVLGRCGGVLTPLRIRSCVLVHTGRIWPHSRACLQLALRRRALRALRVFRPFSGWRAARRPLLVRSPACRLGAHHTSFIRGRLERSAGREAARADLVAHLVPLRADGGDEVGAGCLGLVGRVGVGVVEVDDVFVVARCAAVGARVLFVCGVGGVCVQLERLGPLLRRRVVFWSGNLRVCYLVSNLVRILRNLNILSVLNVLSALGRPRALNGPPRAALCILSVLSVLRALITAIGLNFSRIARMNSRARRRRTPAQERRENLAVDVGLGVLAIFGRRGLRSLFNRTLELFRVLQFRNVAKVAEVGWAGDPRPSF